MVWSFYYTLNYVRLTGHLYSEEALAKLIFPTILSGERRDEATDVSGVGGSADLG